MMPFIALIMSWGLTFAAWRRFRHLAPAHAWWLAILVQAATVAGYATAENAGHGTLFVGCAVLALAGALFGTLVPRLTRTTAPAALALAVTVAGLGLL